MEFNSLIFLTFFTIFFLVYWLLPGRRGTRNVLLTAASYMFYCWWDWRFGALLLVTTLSTFYTAQEAWRGHRQLWTSLNIVLNLGILAAFKYLNFFTENLGRLASLMGWNLDWFTLDVLVPVGISFYTFQAIGYSVDVYRREIAPCRSLLDFSLFMSFFPQLLAGPIERASYLLPQLSTPRRWNARLALDGARETLWGLFKKVAVADPCGLIVSRVFEPEPDVVLHPWMPAVGAILFTIQIYCDFSGYSNMARGLAAMLGVRLSVNFRYPFIARSPRDFWHRWHVTLMEWFRRYVYIPLGGSRHGLATTCRNIAIVFLLSGLWHGAGWNFIVWGALWGTVMVVDRLLSATYKGLRLPRYLSLVVTATIVIIAFVIFRANDLSTAARVLREGLPWLAVAMVLLWGVIILYNSCPRGSKIVSLAALGVGVVTAAVFLPTGLFIALYIKSLPVVAIAIVLIIELNSLNEPYGLRKSGRWSRPARVSFYWLLLLLVMLSSTTSTQFIYYQF